MENLRTLESNGFKLGKTKIKYLECKFSDETHEIDIEVRLRTQVIQKRGSFRKIDDDVKHYMIQGG